jgi:hypothetical protein
MSWSAVVVVWLWWMSVSLMHYDSPLVMLSIPPVSVMYSTSLVTRHLLSTCRSAYMCTRLCQEVVISPHQPRAELWRPMQWTWQTLHQKVEPPLCLAMFVCFRSGRKCKLFNCYFRALYRERSSTINISPNCDRSGDSTERFPHYRQSHRNSEGSNVHLKDYIKFL